MAEDNYEEILKGLVMELTGREALSCMPVTTGSASPRRYFRLATGQRFFIGTINQNKKENKAFLYLTNHFLEHGLPVPEVLATDPEGVCYLQQDLGNQSLFGLLSHSSPEEHEPLLAKALELLVQFQVKGAFGLDFDRCYPSPEFDRQAALWDLHYFKYMFLKLSGVEFDDEMLEKEFEYMLDAIFGDCTNGFMYRDFQSRNIMIAHGRLWFIDYQGGRRGPLAYDVASFLYQSRIALPEPLRERLLESYCRELQEYIDVDQEHFRQQVRGFALLRLLQTLGTYGYRGLFEHKEAFRKPIVPALQNTFQVFGLNSGKLSLTYLQSLLQKALPLFVGSSQQKSGLVIRINSFSYMHGLPKDATGNGGGFVFDCRALPNPHRDEKLRPFTGKDPVIQEWLGGQKEVKAFLNHCEALIMASVNDYLNREFTDLQVNFGCTGGKHRSVYCAETIYERLQASGNQYRLIIHHNNLG
ncbi:MAG: RNase adapter RapZ [Bacteroidales bacterium]